MFFATVIATGVHQVVGLNLAEPGEEFQFTVSTGLVAARYRIEERLLHEGGGVHALPQP